MIVQDLVPSINEDNESLYVIKNTTLGIFNSKKLKFHHKKQNTKIKKRRDLLTCIIKYRLPLFLWRL